VTEVPSKVCPSKYCTCATLAPFVDDAVAVNPGGLDKYTVLPFAGEAMATVGALGAASVVARR